MSEGGFVIVNRLRWKNYAVGDLVKDRLTGKTSIIKAIKIRVPSSASAEFEPRDEDVFFVVKLVKEVGEVYKRAADVRLLRKAKNHKQKPAVPSTKEPYTIHTGSKLEQETQRKISELKEEDRFFDRGRLNKKEARKALFGRIKASYPEVEDDIVEHLIDIIEVNADVPLDAVPSRPNFHQGGFWTVEDPASIDAPLWIEEEIKRVRDEIRYRQTRQRALRNLYIPKKSLEIIDDEDLRIKTEIYGEKIVELLKTSAEEFPDQEGVRFLSPKVEIIRQAAMEESAAIEASKENLQERLRFLGGILGEFLPFSRSQEQSGGSTSDEIQDLSSIYGPFNEMTLEDFSQWRQSQSKLITPQFISDRDKLKQILQEHEQSEGGKVSPQEAVEAIYGKSGRRGFETPRIDKELISYKQEVGAFVTPEEAVNTLFPGDINVSERLRFLASLREYQEAMGRPLSPLEIIEHVYGGVSGREKELQALQVQEIRKSRMVDVVKVLDLLKIDGDKRSEALKTVNDVQKELRRQLTIDEITQVVLSPAEMEDLRKFRLSDLIKKEEFSLGRRLSFEETIELIAPDAGKGRKKEYMELLERLSESKNPRLSMEQLAIRIYGSDDDRSIGLVTHLLETVTEHEELRQKTRGNRKLLNPGEIFVKSLKEDPRAAETPIKHRETGLLMTVEDIIESEGGEEVLLSPETVGTPSFWRARFKDPNQPSRRTVADIIKYVLDGTETEGLSEEEIVDLIEDNKKILNPLPRRINIGTKSYTQESFLRIMGIYDQQGRFISDPERLFSTRVGRAFVKRGGLEYLVGESGEDLVGVFMQGFLEVFSDSDTFLQVHEINEKFMEDLSAAILRTLGGRDEILTMLGKESLAKKFKTTSLSTPLGGAEGEEFFLGDVIASNQSLIDELEDFRPNIFVVSRDDIIKEARRRAKVDISGTMSRMPEFFTLSEIERSSIEATGKKSKKDLVLAVTATKTVLKRKAVSASYSGKGGNIFSYLGRETIKDIRSVLAKKRARYNTNEIVESLFGKATLKELPVLYEIVGNMLLPKESPYESLYELEEFDVPAVFPGGAPPENLKGGRFWRIDEDGPHLRHALPAGDVPLTPGSTIKIRKGIGFDIDVEKFIETSAKNLSVSLLSGDDRHVDIASAIAMVYSGVDVKEGTDFSIEAENLSELEQRVNSLGRSAFEVGKVGDIEGVLAEAVWVNAEGEEIAATPYIVPFERAELNWDRPFEAAIPKGQFAMGDTEPGELKASGGGTPKATGPQLVYDITTGEAYAETPFGEAKFRAQDLGKYFDFEVREDLGEFTPLSKHSGLPLYKMGEGYVALDMEGGPAAQIKRAASILENNETYLAIDIEAYGRGYSRLGNVGVIEKKVGEEAKVLYNASFEGWMGMRNLTKESLGGTIIKGSLGSVEEMDAAEVQMVLEVAEILEKNNRAKILIYNEGVDLLKLAEIAHNQSTRVTDPEISAKLSRAYITLIKANKNRAVNVMFLESASRGGGFESLQATAVRAGVSIGKQAHTGVADAILTADVFEKRGAEYTSLPQEGWREVRAGEFLEKTFWGSPSRIRHQYGVEQDVDMSNRFLTIESIGRSIDDTTGTSSWSMVLQDYNNNASRTIYADSPIDLMIQLENLLKIDTEAVNVEEEEKRIARDLMNRRVYAALFGEQNANYGPEFLTLADRYRISAMGAFELKEEIETLTSLVQADVATPKDKYLLRWITGRLLVDERIKRQYDETRGWFEGHFLRFDQPFFDKLEDAMRKRRITPFEAQLIAKRRMEWIYGVDKETTFFKTLAMDKPFHEWTITPDIESSYRIRMRNLKTTKYDVETFILQTFSRKYKETEKSRLKGMEILREALGDVTDEQTLADFFETGFFPRKTYYLREMLVEHLIKAQETHENTPLVELIFRAARVNYKGSLTNLNSTEIARIIREHMLANQEDQLKNNPSLNKETQKIIWHRGVESRQYKNPKAVEKEIKRRSKIFWELFFDPETGELTRGGADYLKKLSKEYFTENPSAYDELLKLTSPMIPKSFINHHSLPSVWGLTPKELIHRDYVGGHYQLARLYMRNMEMMQFYPTETFLNEFQVEEIGKILKWRGLGYSIYGVKRGEITPVQIGKEVLDLSEAKIPIGKNVISFATFLENKTYEEAVEKLTNADHLPEIFKHAVDIYFGKRAPIKPENTEVKKEDVEAALGLSKDSPSTPGDSESSTEQKPLSTGPAEPDTAPVEPAQTPKPPDLSVSQEPPDLSAELPDLSVSQEPPDLSAELPDPGRPMTIQETNLPKEGVKIQVVTAEELGNDTTPVDISLEDMSSAEEPIIELNKPVSIQPPDTPTTFKIIEVGREELGDDITPVQVSDKELQESLSENLAGAINIENEVYDPTLAAVEPAPTAVEPPAKPIKPVPIEPPTSSGKSPPPSPPRKPPSPPPPPIDPPPPEKLIPGAQERKAIEGEVENIERTIIDEETPEVTSFTSKKFAWARRIIDRINRKIKSAADKGISAGRSAMNSAHEWAVYSGRAERLGETLSGIISESSDELIKKIKSSMSNPKVYMGVVGAGLLLTAMAVSSHGKRDEPESFGVDDGAVEFSEEKTNSKPVSIIARIRGDVSGNIDPQKITESIHAAIEMHVPEGVNKTQKISDSRETLNAHLSAKIATNLLR